VLEISLSVQLETPPLSSRKVSPVPNRRGAGCALKVWWRISIRGPGSNLGRRSRWSVMRAIELCLYRIVYGNNIELAATQNHQRKTTGRMWRVLDFVQWLRLALSKGRYRVDISLPTTQWLGLAFSKGPNGEGLSLSLSLPSAQWLKLVLSKEPNKINDSFSSQHGNKSSFPNVVVSSY
jgi:hypothetical protein